MFSSKGWLQRRLRSSILSCSKSAATQNHNKSVENGKRERKHTVAKKACVWRWLHICTLTIPSIIRQVGQSFSVVSRVCRSAMLPSSASYPVFLHPFKHNLCLEVNILWSACPSNAGLVCAGTYSAIISWYHFVLVLTSAWPYLDQLLPIISQHSGTVLYSSMMLQTANTTNRISRRPLLSVFWKIMPLLLKICQVTALSPFSEVLQCLSDSRQWFWQQCVQGRWDHRQSQTVCTFRRLWSISTTKKCLKPVLCRSGQCFSFIRLTNIDTRKRREEQLQELQRIFWIVCSFDAHSLASSDLDPRFQENERHKRTNCSS